MIYARTFVDTNPSLDQGNEWDEEKCRQVKSLLNNFSNVLSKFEGAYNEAAGKAANKDSERFFDLVTSGNTFIGSYAAVRTIEAGLINQAIIGKHHLYDESGAINFGGRKVPTVVKGLGKAAGVLGVVIDGYGLVTADNGTDAFFSASNIALYGGTLFSPKNAQPYVAAFTVGWTLGQVGNTAIDHFTDYDFERFTTLDNFAKEIYPQYTDLSDAYRENCNE